MDILLANVPRISLVYPPAGTSLLKGMLQNAGFSAIVKDYNIEFFNGLNINDHDFDEISNYFTVKGNVSNKNLEIINQWYQTTIEDILKINPKFVGISVFTFECQRATEELCVRLRKVYNGKIIIGGAGLSTTGIASQSNDFGNKLKQLGLVDHYIRGEGEFALVELLKNNLNYNGLDNDNYKQIENLDDIPFPDYDDVIKNNYHYPIKRTQLPVTTSRGCVRQCTFCDIHAFWKKYTFRSGENVAQEMISHYNKYGVKDFFFTDSLINGSLKSFRNLYETLNDYYKNNNLPDKFFSWGGQFIVRNKKQLSPEDYVLAAKSGMNGLAMGIESLSERVRDDMKKGFTNNDLDFTLEQFRKNNINCYFLMIVGYPTETEEDFQESLEMFTKYQGYAIDGTIFGVNLGGTLSIDEGSPLHQNANELDLHSFSGSKQVFGLDWINKNNPTLTPLERVRRRIVLQEILMDLGYTIWNGDHQLTRLKESYDRIQNNTYHS